MLRKLRIKFVLVIMAIVSIMLGIIFGMIYYSTVKNLERESLQMMRMVSMDPMQERPINRPRDNVNLPYMSVLIGQNGEVLKLGGGYVETTDEEYLEGLLNEVLSTDDHIGVLKEYSLRFSVEELPAGKLIVFVDMTSEKSTLKNLVQAFFMIGGIAFFIFLLVSIFLARWAVKPIEKAWEQQKQFVADASHELKTPLTVIMTDADLLHEKDCPESDREILSSNILTMSHQMRGLVESLLDLARLDNAGSAEQFKNEDLSDIVSETVMTFEPVFFEKGLTLSYDIAPDISTFGSGLQLRRLVGILLDNAVKYTLEKGDVKLKLFSKNAKTCVLEVSNRGEAIGKEDLKNIFKRFYRTDKVRSMDHSYGLGLSIAEGIVERHRGKIWAESSEGYNRFFVELQICRTTDV
ncbi:MAG: HAMP domain-containing histidine kinase [Lachnospiraceae bacterium]|nr:HAMP domain-containing histidine kinase [Lachnospiraceae bacterium]